MKWKSLAVLGLVFGMSGMTWGLAQQRQTNRFFELRVYTAAPDRMDKLVARFRNHTTRLFEKHGMTIVDAERVPLHHGQLRVHVQRRGEAKAHDRVAQVLAGEKAARLDRYETYVNFAAHVQTIKKQLHEVLTELKRDGHRLAGYGAPAKGNTLLSFLEFGPEHLPYIVDRSPLKQGRFTPGTHIPVVAPEQLLVDQPDYVLLLAWNFADEIVQQQAEYRKRGGKFMVPVPEVRVL